jgi:hypothetical protein
MENHLGTPILKNGMNDIQHFRPYASKIFYFPSVVDSELQYPAAVNLYCQYYGP